MNDSADASQNTNLVDAAARNTAASPASDLSQRVRAYLRTLGFANQRMLDTATQRVLNRLESIGHIDSPDDVAKAMEQVMQWSRSWLEGFARQAEVSPEHTALLGYGIRRRLMNCHGGLQDQSMFPRIEPKTLEQSLGPALPSETLSEMPTQPLADVPRVFKRRFWRRGFRKVNRVREGLSERIKSE